MSRPGVCLKPRESDPKTEASNPVTGRSDKTLSRFCPVQKSKNFVSRARNTPLRSVFLSAWEARVAGPVPSRQRQRSRRWRWSGPGAPSRPRNRAAEPDYRLIVPYRAAVSGVGVLGHRYSLSVGPPDASHRGRADACRVNQPACAKLGPALGRLPRGFLDDLSDFGGQESEVEARRAASCSTPSYPMPRIGSGTPSAGPHTSFSAIFSAPRFWFRKSRNQLPLVDQKS